MDNPFSVVIAVGLGLLGFFSWLQHLITCFSEGLWGFLVAGAILPPIGMVHGIGIWLGAW